MKELLKHLYLQTRKAQLTAEDHELNTKVYQQALADYEAVTTPIVEEKTKK